MHCINLTTTDPYFNIAVDEYLLKNTGDEYFILGINEPAVVIGKHQVAHRETETRFVYERKIPVIRRISGGGTVFHDQGNLNFSFILNTEPGKQVDFKKYTKPVIDFLRSAGVPAEFAGKNDIKVNGLKISGNAEHVWHNRVLHHGTLLFDSDMEMLESSIRKDTGRYVTRGVTSNPSRVINIRKVFDCTAFTSCDTVSFKSMMMKWFLNNFQNTGEKNLSEPETEGIRKLAEAKYLTWEWNYAYGPEYTFTNSFSFTGKETAFRIVVREGIIAECIFSGPEPLAALGKKLTGLRHMVDDLIPVMKNENPEASGFDIFDLF